MRKMGVSSMLLLLAGALFIQGATVFEGSPTRDVTVATYYVVVAIYYVGAAITFAIALIPWSKE